MTGSYAENRDLARQGLRFLFTGGLNTLVGYGLYLVGLWAGLPAEAALAVATVFGAIFNYFSTGRLVFRYGAADRLPRFIGAYVLIYAANALLLRILVPVFGHPAVVQALLLPFVAAASFALFRFFVFNPRPGRWP